MDCVGAARMTSARAAMLAEHESVVASAVSRLHLQRLD